MLPELHLFTPHNTNHHHCVGRRRSRRRVCIRRGPGLAWLGLGCRATRMEQSQFCFSRMVLIFGFFSLDMFFWLSSFGFFWFFSFGSVLLVLLFWFATSLKKRPGAVGSMHRRIPGRCKASMQSQVHEPRRLRGAAGFDLASPRLASPRLAARRAARLRFAYASSTHPPPPSKRGVASPRRRPRRDCIIAGVIRERPRRN